MTEKQYLKLKSKLSMRNCPACNQQTIRCNGKNVNLFDSSRCGENYKEVEIPDTQTFDFVCPNCGFVMTFNIPKLLE